MNKEMNKKANKVYTNAYHIASLKKELGKEEFKIENNKDTYDWQTPMWKFNRNK